MVSSLQTERLEWTQRLQNADLRIRAQPDPPGIALISFLLDLFHAFLDRLVLLKVSTCLKKVFALSAARWGGGSRSRSRLSIKHLRIQSSLKQMPYK